MTQVSHKSGFEEKGQRTVRSSDVYLPKAGSKEAALCQKCGALYQNKRWTIDATELQKAGGTNIDNKVICPACQRMADNNPAGIVTLSGSYLWEHRDEILNTIKHVESKSRLKNPLGRIMEISEEKGIITVTTTEDKLAQKLGREVYKSQKGELRYQWSHEQNSVRVEWSR